MTAFFNWLPAENFGTVAAGMWTFWLGLRGFTPSRAARRVVWNLPKPVNATVSPFRRASVMHVKHRVYGGACVTAGHPRARRHCIDEILLCHCLSS